MIRKSALLVAALFGFSAGPLHAQNTGGVFGPVVNEGHRAFEYRLGYDPDVESFAQRLHYQQSLNGTAMWRLIAQGRKTDGGSQEFDFVQGELFWQITPDAASWQQGLRFDLRVRDDDRPGTVGVNWMHQLPLAGDWRARGILLTAMEVGQNRREGILLQTRAQVARAVRDGGLLGLEMFSGYGSTDDFPDLDEQSHQLGPFVALDAGRDVTVYASALFGLTDGAPDTNLALWITRSF